MNYYLVFFVKASSTSFPNPAVWNILFFDNIIFYFWGQIIDFLNKCKIIEIFTINITDIHAYTRGIYNRSWHYYNIVWPQNFLDGSDLNLYLNPILFFLLRQHLVNSRYCLKSRRQKNIWRWTWERISSTRIHLGEGKEVGDWQRCMDHGDLMC